MFEIVYNPKKFYSPENDINYKVILICLIINKFNVGNKGVTYKKTNLIFWSISSDENFDTLNKFIENRNKLPFWEIDSYFQKTIFYALCNRFIYASTNRKNLNLTHQGKLLADEVINTNLFSNILQRLNKLKNVTDSILNKELDLL